MKTVQLKSISMAGQVTLNVNGMEGAHRATGVPSTFNNTAKHKPLPPAPEVQRQSHGGVSPPPTSSASYKNRCM